MSIPKIIHQVWIGPNKIPTIWIDTFSVDYLNMYPNWKYMLWTDDNIHELFINFPIIKSIYDLEKTYNGKSDLLRYLILYNHGGIYIDADSVWINNKNFSDLLDQVNETGMFLAYEPINPNDLEPDKVCGGVMGSTKKNKYMKLIIEGIENIVKDNDGSIKLVKYKRLRSVLGVVKSIGPGFLDKMCKTFDKRITIFPSIYFYPVTWHGLESEKEHLCMDLPEESYTFQYGYTTNKFEKKI